VKFVFLLLIASFLPLSAQNVRQCPVIKVASCAEHQKALMAQKDRILAGMKLVQHDKAGFDLYETPAGKYWIPQGDKVSYMLPFNLAEQAVQIYGKGQQLVRRGDIVLDCGANVGVFTRVALDAGAAKVYAIEPAPENLESLRRNFQGEIATGHVIVVPKGVWDKEDTLTLNVDPTNSAADSFVIKTKGSVEVQKVPLTTIDRLVDDMRIERVDYIKMDIEGAEPNALAGAAQTIRKWKPRISVSAYHAPDHQVRIPRAIFRARPDYTLECGPCAEVNGKARPDILWFR
jgi:FkbM family methyltransferase